MTIHEALPCFVPLIRRGFHREKKKEKINFLRANQKKFLARAMELPPSEIIRFEANLRYSAAIDIAIRRISES